MKINPVPKIKFYNSGPPETEIPGETSNENSHKPIHKSGFKETFIMFYSNVSSLSPHALDYLFSLPGEVKALLIVESHKDYNFVLDRFTSNNYSATYSQPETNSESTSHGGGNSCNQVSYPQ